MCQKAPGPRCAGHIRKELIAKVLKIKVLESNSQKKVEQYHQIAQLRNECENLRFQYHGTPTGQKELQHNIDMAGGDSEDNPWLKIQRDAKFAYDKKRKLGKVTRRKEKEEQGVSHSYSVKGVTERKVSETLMQTYGSVSPQLMESIVAKLDSKPDESYDNVRNAIWMHHSGGSTAESATQRIFIGLDRRDEINEDLHLSLVRDIAAKQYDETWGSVDKKQDIPEDGIASMKNSYINAVMQDKETTEVLVDLEGADMRRAHQRDAVLPPSPQQVPSSTRVSPHVKIAPTAKIGENSKLTSGVSVGSYAKIGSSVLLDDHVRVGNYSTVGDGAVLLDETTVGSKTTIGKKAYLEFDVHVGNNVTIDDDVTVPSGSVISDNSHVTKKTIFPQKTE